MPPIRCFDGNAQPYAPFWTFRNAAETDSGEVELEFYGPISEFSWWGDEITPALFKQQLFDNGKKGPVTVRLNSPGGDLIAASVIRATMLDYPGKITVKVDGLAASAAVLVALGGDKVLMQVSAYMMIHDPAVGILGYYSVPDLKSMIDELKVIKDGIVESYAARTKLEPDKLSKMMSDETWMTASEAVALGFADALITGSTKAPASAASYTNFFSQFVNTPRSLLLPEPQPAVPPQPSPEALRLQAEARLLA